MSKKTQITEHLKALGLKPIREERREIRRPLTDEELSVTANAMAEHALKSKSIEDEKKAVTKVLGDAQKKEDETVQALAKKYKDRYEDEMDNVIVAIDYTTKTRKVFAITSGLMVAEEALTTQDLQVEIFEPTAETEETAEGAAAAPDGPPEVIIMGHNPPPPLEIGFEEVKDGEIVVEGSAIVVDDSLAGELVAQAEAIEEKKICTQIRLVENKKGGAVCLVTTAEKIVLFTEGKADMAIASAAMQTKKYVNIRYEANPANRNQKILEIDFAEIPSADDVLAQMEKEPLPRIAEEGDSDPDDNTLPDLGDIGDIEEGEDVD